MYLPRYIPLGNVFRAAETAISFVVEKALKGNQFHLKEKFDAVGSKAVAVLRLCLECGRVQIKRFLPCPAN